MNHPITDKTRFILDGLQDLSGLMCDEDRGSPYINRLAKEMESLFVDLLTYFHRIETQDVRREEENRRRSEHIMQISSNGEIQ